MGSYDGAENCELVCLYILNILSTFGVNLGLYRDGGLGASSKTRRQMDILKKEIKETFAKIGLDITRGQSQGGRFP